MWGQIGQQIWTLGNDVGPVSNLVTLWAFLQPIFLGMLAWLYWRVRHEGARIRSLKQDVDRRQRDIEIAEARADKAEKLVERQTGRMPEEVLARYQKLRSGEHPEHAHQALVQWLREEGPHSSKVLFELSSWLQSVAVGGMRAAAYSAAHGFTVAAHVLDVENKQAGSLIREIETWQRQERLESATFSKALDTLLGADHHETFSASTVDKALEAYEQGKNLAARGLFLMARPLFERAVEQMTDQLGVRNAKTLAARSSLSTTISRLGRPDTVIEEFGEILRLQDEICGSGDSETVRTVFGLSGALDNLERGQEAVDRLASTVEELAAQPDSDQNVDYATANFMMARLLSRLNRLDEAEIYVDRALELERNHPQIGDQHRNYAASLQTRAQIISKRGRKAEALDLVRQVIATRAVDKELGLTHPQTLIAREFEARLMSDLGDHDGAIKKIESVVADALQHSSLGADNRDTLIFQVSEASILSAAGLALKALTLARALLPKLTAHKAIGSESFDTKLCRSIIDRIEKTPPLAQSSKLGGHLAPLI